MSRFCDTGGKAGIRWRPIGRLKNRLMRVAKPMHRRAPQVTLYTRQGCHLCDDAQALLVECGLQPQLVDIDADPTLRARYSECVPVVEIDGKVRFRGRVDRVL